jgi:hypothetical protein
MVKKLEKGETTTSVKLYKKEVPKAINEAGNMNKEKSKDSISHVVSTDHSSMFSKHKREEAKGDASSVRNQATSLHHVHTRKKRMEQGVLFDATMRTKWSLHARSWRIKDLHSPRWPSPKNKK